MKGSYTLLYNNKIVGDAFVLSTAKVKYALHGAIKVQEDTLDNLQKQFKFVKRVIEA